MDLAPLIVLNGYPGVGKAAIASNLRELIPNSRFFDNHLLIDPAAALLERDDLGYRDLRKALRAPILDFIANNPALQRKAVITTYYQETFDDSHSIDLEEFYEYAKQGGRHFMVFILRCSEKENIRRFLTRSAALKSKLTDLTILEDILHNHHLYSFYKAGFQPPDVWEYELNIDDKGPREAATEILNLIIGHEKASTA